MVPVERQPQVKDAIIAKPVAISSSASPRDLAVILIEHGISGVPVVDHQNRLISVDSRTDLLQWCVRGGLGFGFERTVRGLDGLLRDCSRVADGHDLAESP
jgi:predicted transcriptional regulator